jgi:hypothetical protein
MDDDVGAVDPWSASSVDKEFGAYCGQSLTPGATQSRTDVIYDQRREDIGV